MLISKNVVTGVPDSIMRAPNGSENILDLPIAAGWIDGQGPAYISKWVPTEQERKTIAEGGVVYLHIIGNIHPPVYVSANEPNVIDYEGNCPIFELK